MCKITTELSIIRYTDIINKSTRHTTISHYLDDIMERTLTLSLYIHAKLLYTCVVRIIFFLNTKF